MTNPTVYPITAKFEKFLTDQNAGLKNRKVELAQIADTMAETLGEYEHGTADAEDLFPTLILDFTDQEELNTQIRKFCLETMRAIYEDAFLTLVNRTSDE